MPVQAIWNDGLNHVIVVKPVLSFGRKEETNCWSFHICLISLNLADLEDQDVIL